MEERKKRKYTKRELITLICPDCKQEVKGTTEKQAKAMIIQHKRSILHKCIVNAMHIIGIKK